MLCSIKRERVPQCTNMQRHVQRQPYQWVAVPMAASAAPWRTVLRALPAAVPRAIEYPLQGDDLLAVTRVQVALVGGAEVAR